MKEIGEKIQLTQEDPNNDSFHFSPIGHIESCFPKKNGCPRQGRLCPTSRAILRINAPKSLDGSTSIDASLALEGIDLHSHIWIIFVFHANQDIPESSTSKNGGKNFKAKVHPPLLGGQSIGIYATRSPHRFVPIGMTVAKLEDVVDNTIYLSGIDLIDGTPVLDIKPYIPKYDIIPEAVTRADWVDTPSTVTDVEFTPEALNLLSNLAYLCPKLNKEEEKVKAVITEMLLADPRSVYRKEKLLNDPFGFLLEGINIQVIMKDTTASVYNIEMSPDTVKNLKISNNKIEENIL
jgi:tRNA-Thr(GGU) m(6)t(6)A37 methyltransferase TsaA